MGAMVAVAATAAVAALALLVGPPRPVSAAAYDRFYANFSSEELMRAMNGDRAALGLSPLAADATLEGLARDRPVTCPSNARLTILGRARDMAARGYLSHEIPGCTTSGGGSYGAFDLLRTAGYTFAAAGEDIAANDYPATATSYATGCSLSGGACRGSVTLPLTVAVVERGFMTSSVHRDNVLSTAYGRFGCGAWSSSSGNHVFSCYFVSGGSGLLDAAGPAVWAMTGVGATYPSGSHPTFNANVADARSQLSDGWAAIDGRHIRDWAWDHAGASAAVTAVAPTLSPGSHTFTWWVRDASTRSTTRSFTFHIGVAGPPPTPAPTLRRTAARTPRPTAARPSTSPAATGAGGGQASASPPIGGGPGSPGPGSTAGATSTGPSTLSSGTAGAAVSPGSARSAASSGGSAGGAATAGAAGTPAAGAAAAVVALALLLLLAIGLVPPAFMLRRSRRSPGSGA